jgi:hypothetical protein
MRKSALLIIFLSAISAVNSFNMVMMARRAKGGLQKNLDGDSDATPVSISSLNKGKGQEITGVTLPAPGKSDILFFCALQERFLDYILTSSLSIFGIRKGKIKGWEFGDKVTMACANVDGRLFAVE